MIDPALAAVSVVAAFLLGAFLAGRSGSRWFFARLKEHHDNLKEVLISTERERRELYTRIQMWEAPTPVPDEPAPSALEPEPKESQVLEDTEKLWTKTELANLWLRPNSDGGYLDTRSGALFDRVEDALEWRASLRGKGLPEDMNPAVVELEGLEAGLTEARTRNGTVKKED